MTSVAATIDLYDPSSSHASLQNKSSSPRGVRSGFVHDRWNLGTSAENAAALRHNHHLFLKWENYRGDLWDNIIVALLKLHVASLISIFICMISFNSKMCMGIIKKGCLHLMVVLQQVSCPVFFRSYRMCVCFFSVLLFVKHSWRSFLAGNSNVVLYFSHVATYAAVYPAVANLRGNYSDKYWLSPVVYVVKLQHPAIYFQYNVISIQSQKCWMLSSMSSELG